MEGKAKKNAKSALRYLVLIILAVLWIVPIVTLFLTAIKAKSDFISGLGKLFKCHDPGAVIPVYEE